MYIIRRYQPQINSFIATGSCRAFSLAYGLLAVVLILLGVLIFKFGSPPMNGRPWDSPVILDGAWRIACGQVPHRDFYNYLGDLPVYSTFWGMKMRGPCMSALDYGNVIVMALMVIPLAGVLRRRTGAVAAFLFSLYIGLTVITPKPMGDPYDWTDHAMLYNRFGEAFMALFVSLLLLPPRPDLAGRWPDWVEAVLAGLAWLALLACKLNYFAVGAGFFVVACVTGRIRPGRAAVCLVSLLAGLAVAAAASGISFSAMMTDYWTMMGCQSTASRLRGVAIQGTKSILLLPVLLLPVWESALGKGAAPGGWRARWRDILVILAIYGGAVALLATDCQLGEMPLLVLGALCGAEMIQRQTIPDDETPFFITARRLGPFALVVVFVMPGMVNDLKCIRYVTFAEIKKNWDAPTALQSTPLADFRFVHEGTRKAEMREYIEELNENVAMLRRHGGAGTRLNVLTFSDPYHAALGWVPARGGIMSVTTDCITPASHPPLARVVGDATLILTGQDNAALTNAYGAAWEALHLEVLDHGKNTILYRVPNSR